MSIREPDRNDATVFVFAGFRLDLLRGTLSDGNREINLRPKSFAVLRFFVENPGRLISKQEILDAVWGQVVVTEDAVTQCVIDVRRALSDTDQSLLRTVPRRGYLLDVTVQQGEEPELSVDDTAGVPAALRPESDISSRRNFFTAAIYMAIAWAVTATVLVLAQQLLVPRWFAMVVAVGLIVGFPVAMSLAWTFYARRGASGHRTVPGLRGSLSLAGPAALLIVGTAGLLLLIRPSLESDKASSREAVGPPNSLAILPFEQVGLTERVRHLSQGMSDELRDQLARTEELQLAARSSSIAVLARSRDARERGRALGVAYLVEGSVRMRAGSLRISVQLVDSSTGLARWSQSFDRSATELLTVQQAIAEDIVSALLPEGTTVPPPATDTASANELMLLARYHEQRVRDEPEVDSIRMSKAIDLYREATEADPQSAVAFSRLAGALLYLGKQEAAEAPVFRALALEPELAEVQLNLSRYYWVRGEVEQARSAAARAVEINPNSADALENYAYLRWFSIETEGVAGLYRKALELDPLTLSRYGALGEFHGKQGQVAETRKIISQVETLFDSTEAFQLLAWLHEFVGELDQSIVWTLRAKKQEPANPVHSQKLAELYAQIGDQETALRIEPEPGVGVLFHMGRYAEVIEAGEFLMIDQPEDLMLRYLLAFAYHATGQWESALYVLSSTGLPESVLEGWRHAPDMFGLMVLISTLSRNGEPELATQLAQQVNDLGGTRSTDWWVAGLRACSLATAGNLAEARDKLQTAAASTRIAWRPVFRELGCYAAVSDEPFFRQMLIEFDTRRAAIRERLPATLARAGLAAPP